MNGSDIWVRSRKLSSPYSKVSVPEWRCRGSISCLVNCTLLLHSNAHLISMCLCIFGWLTLQLIPRTSSQCVLAHTRSLPMDRYSVSSGPQRWRLRNSCIAICIIGRASFKCQEWQCKEEASWDDSRWADVRWLLAWTRVWYVERLSRDPAASERRCELSYCLGLGTSILNMNACIIRFECARRP